MAGSFSDYLENKILDFIFSAASYTPPATVYVALFTANPSDSGGGTEVSTGSWTNYARIAVTNNATNFPAASGGSKSNGTSIDFGTAATTGSVTVTAFGIYDASTAGNLLAWAIFSVAPVVQNGNPVKFNISGLTIQLD